MTAYAPTAVAVPRPQLALVTLLVLTAHALLLLGLPYWAHTVPVNGGPPVFQFRTLAPPSAAAPEQAAPEPPPKPALKPKPEPALERTATPPPVAAADGPVSLLQGPPRATFGGVMPLPPIAAPLPPDQALAVVQQAAQPRPAGSAAADARTPGAPDPSAPVQLPRPAQMVYQTTLTQGGKPVTLPSTVNWRHDGQSYELRWTLYGPAIGDRSRYATGLVTARGLAPVTARAQGPGGYSLTFDYAQARLLLDPTPVGDFAPAAPPGAAATTSDATPAVPLPSASAADTALPPGAQDPLSLLIELGALIAGNPAQYPVGSQIALPVAAGGGAAASVTGFTVMDEDGFAAAGQFAGQTIPALHLVHFSTDERDARIELWLGKLLDYLPLRLLIAPPQGDQLDMTLQSAYTQTVPLAAPSPPAEVPGKSGAGQD